ncbi:MAG: leucine-rich repeat protein [Paludibacteraceae bacterium]|nr:leucine-rich repeat protein [Paludibacteraceae bacterium]
MKRHFFLLFLMVFCYLAAVQAAEPDYFTVKNTHASQKLTVQLKRGSNPPTNVTLTYRVIDAANNAGEWQTLTTVNNTTNYTLGDIPAGSRMQLYGNNSSKGFGQGTMNYWKFYFGTTGNAVLSGELMSIFSGTETSIDITKTLPSYAFYGLFYENSANNPCIISAKDLKLSATNLGQYCYKNMFNSCANMKDAPALPATTLQPYCYEMMFDNCTSLTEAPALPAMTLANYCYSYMFSDCSSLKAAPNLPATTLKEGCYRYMFQNCTSLVTIQDELPGTDMPKNCYQYMFSGCSALTTAPEIMASANAVPGGSACDEMFASCTNLIKAPSKLLPEKLSSNMAYSHMFYDCPNLTEGPDIYATNITASNPLQYMFHSSGNMRKIRVYFKAWGSMSFSSYWTYNVASQGAFYCPPELTRSYNSTKSTPSFIPDNWTIFSYNLTYIPVEGEWPMGGTDPQQYTWQTDTNYVQGWMRELDAAGASYWHDQACTESFPEEEIIAFLATQQESSSDITKNIYVKLGAVNKVKITFIDHDDKVLAEINVPVGSLPVYPYDNPAPYSVGDKIYSFVGWSPAIVEATENATYRAVYSDSERYAFVVYPLADEDQNEFECSPAAKPVVLTNDATSVTSGGAVLNGQVTSDGGQTVSERGFCWGTAPESLTNCTAAGDGTGAFSHTLSGLDASTTYYYQAYATNGIGTARGEVRSFTTEAEVDLTCNHEWVQLWEGGPKWATMNIGASSPEDVGDYFMWGGTTANPSSCSWSSCPYKGSNQNSSPYTKYGVAGDGNLELDKEDDAAAQVWGCGWRIPTREEYEDLLANCTVTYSSAKKGYTFTSKEDPSLSIFMPTAGYKKDNTVWYDDGSKYARYLTATSTASPSTIDRDCYILYWYVKNIYTEEHKPEVNTQSIRYWGMSVRAVCD